MIKLKVYLTILVSVLILSQCSFDTKTKIWKNAANDNQFSISNDRVKQLIDLNPSDDNFDQKIEFKDQIQINNLESQKNIKWINQYLNSSNHIPNLFYNSGQTILSKSKKLSNLNKTEILRLNYKIPFLLLNDDKLVSYDNKGTIFIYSLNEKKKIFKYNFYHKAYKKYFKILNFTISEDNILVVTDNLGFVYAIDLNKYQIIWAKNIGIPLRSNVLIEKSQIFFSDENNNLYSISAINGENNWKLATTSSSLSSEFKNSLTINSDTNTLFFLTTSGEFYALNYEIKQIKWVINFKNPSNKLDIFYSTDPVVFKNQLFLSKDNNFISVENDTGRVLWSKNIKAKIVPKFTNQTVNIYTDSGNLVSLDYNNGNVIWSKKIFDDINDEFNITQKKVGEINDILILNGSIIMFSNNGYMIEYDTKGNIKKLSKIVKNIFSNIIVVDGNLFFLDKNIRLIKLS